MCDFSCVPENILKVAVILSKLRKDIHPNDIPMSLKSFMMCYAVTRGMAVLMHRILTIGSGH